SASFAINSSGWNDLSPNDFYQFGFTTTIPYSVSQLTLGLRSSNTGPGFVDLLYSKDGGAFTPLASVNPIELFGTDFNNLTAHLPPTGVANNSLISPPVVAPAHPTNALFNQTPQANSAIGSAGTFRFGSFSPPPGTDFVDPGITGQALATPEPA